MASKIAKYGWLKVDISKVLSKLYENETRAVGEVVGFGAEDNVDG